MARTKKSENKEIKIQEIVNAIQPVVSTIEWNGITIKIKDRLTISDIVSFTYKVSELCFTENNSEYLPEVMKFAIGIETIEYYTDLELPESTDDKYKLVAQTDLVEHVVEHIDQVQYADVVAAADEKTSYKADSAISMARKEIEEIYLAAKSLFDKISEAFSGLTPDDFKTMVTTISNNGLDEAKLMEAYLNHKKD